MQSLRCVSPGDMTVGSCLPKCQRERASTAPGSVQTTEQARSHRGHLAEDEVIPGGGKTARIFHRTHLPFTVGKDSWNIPEDN